jgi:Mg-chelatase subunit ChlD
MKYLSGLLCILALATGFAVSPATGTDPVFFEGEGFVVPTEMSRTGLAPGTRLLAADSAGASAIRMTVDASGFPAIEIFATVPDADGEPMTGLSEADFRILEQSALEGAPTERTLTCFEEISASGEGVRFSLAFDVSQSMNFSDRLIDAKAAAVDFLAGVDPADRGSLVSFSGCGQGGVAVPLSPVGADTDGDGVSDLAAGIDGLAPIGLTALFDGIGDALDTLIDAPFPKGVIVFTDGQSNADCRYTLAGVIDKARAAGIPVHTIGLALDPASPAELQLMEIADRTGATYTPAPTAADMADIYRRIAETIRSQYRLCYTTHNPAFDGAERTVTAMAEGVSGTGFYTPGDAPANRPPTIAHAPVSTGFVGQAIEISAEATDPDPDDFIASVTLFHRPGNGADPDAYVEIPMIPVGGNTWTGTIPGEAVTLGGLEYYLSAVDSRNAAGRAGSAESPFVVTVSPAAPRADAGSDRSVGEGDTAMLDGSGSISPLPDARLTFAWTQIGGPAVDLSDPGGPTPVFAAPEVDAGGAVLVFELTVTDSQGRTDTDTVRVTVNDRMAPTAAFDFSPAEPEAGEPARFADRSTPADAPIVAWNWDFGGSGTASGPDPEFVFPDPGTYAVTLVVVDADGGTGTVVRSVTVREPPCVEEDCGGGSGGCFLRILSGDSPAERFGTFSRRRMER